MKNKSLTFLIAFFITIGLIFTNGCQDDDGTAPPVDVTELAPPQNVNLSLNAVTGGGSIAQITWNASTDEGLGDFKGYGVVTNKVTQSGQRISTFDSLIVNKGQSRFHNVSSIERGEFYQTRVYSINDDNDRSQAITTLVYAGVYAGSGTIDQFDSNNNEAQSGFGWDTTFFGGTQYPFSSANFGLIDMHARADGSNLNFVSPNTANNNARTTLYAQLSGTGEDAFDLTTSLPEPTVTSISVVVDNVYLLKTQSGHYIKIWVQNISQTGGVTSISFEYKAQPVRNFRVLKR